MSGFQEWSHERLPAAVNAVGAIVWRGRTGWRATGGAQTRLAGLTVSPRGHVSNPRRPTLGSNRRPRGLQFGGRDFNPSAGQVEPSHPGIRTWDQVCRSHVHSPLDRPQSFGRVATLLFPPVPTLDPKFRPPQYKL